MTFRRIAAIAAVLCALTRPLSAQIIDTGSVSAQAGASCATALSCASFTLPPTTPSVTLQVSGTFSATLTFEATADGTNWNTITVVNTADGTTATTTTTTGSFSFSNSGIVGIRVRAGTYASGTATVAAVKGYSSARILWPVFGPTTITVNGIATTSTNGLTVQNTTAATAGVTVQMSPRIRLCGNAWDTAASESVCFFSETLPATAATPTGTLKFGYSLNGAAATYPLTLTSVGGVIAGNGTAGAPIYTFTGSPTSGLFRAGGDVLDMSLAGTGYMRFEGSSFELRAGTTLGWSSGSLGAGRDLLLFRTAAGKMSLTTGTSTNGVCLDGSVDAVLKIQADDCSTAAALQLTGKTTLYNGIATAGQGLAAIYGENISSTQTSNFTALTYTPPATAGRYEVSADITTTSATNTGTVQVTVDYVDSQGTTHTADIIPLVDATGTIATTKTGASKEFHSLVWKISINNAATAIVIKVVITGAVSYTVSPSIVQVA